jgi:DNA-binding NtrC family response regulator
MTQPVYATTFADHYDRDSVTNPIAPAGEGPWTLIEITPVVMKNDWPVDSVVRLYWTWIKLQALPAEAPTPTAELSSLAAVEREHILRVLVAVGGNKSVAAKTLGIDRRSLYRRLHELRL